MGNTLSSRQSKLKERQEAFDALPPKEQAARCRPGSMNDHKQIGGVPKLGGRKRRS